jgi:NADH-quinone oxidoreductase subunit A
VKFRAGRATSPRAPAACIALREETSLTGRSRRLTVYHRRGNGKYDAVAERKPRTEAAMEALLISYLPIIVFVGICIVIGVALMAAPFLVAYKAPDAEKYSAYECGFNAFDDARMKFDVRFYLVSILFIIFDLEVAFLFPWAVSFGALGWFGYVSMMVFLAVLTIGFIYEWKKGALEWD